MDHFPFLIPQTSCQYHHDHPLNGGSMQEIWRILDANFNRAAEGLRVIEDFLRFANNNRGLAEQYKQLRHALNALREPHASMLLAQRDTLHDVGVDVSTEQELTRRDPQHVAFASQARVEQALRCIEEYMKTLTVSLAGGNTTPEALRYRLYTLGRAWQNPLASPQKLDSRQLYALIDDCGGWPQLTECAAAAIRGGVSMLQWRAKKLTDREVLHGARLLRTVTRDLDCLFIINDRPDIALLADADGVHVGQEELPVHEARRVLGPDRIVGVSTHSLEQARQAVLDGADYIGCGPVFPSQTKTFATHAGIPLLEAVAADLALPAFAIGGITAARLPEIISAGFHRVAVSYAVFGEGTPEASARVLRDKLKEF